LLASSATYADRFRSLGFRADQVSVTGNIKVDIVINENSGDEVQKLRASLGFEEQDMILLGASTWPGEEAALIKVWQEARQKSDRPLRLLLVPRHAERRDNVEAVLATTGAKYTVRSRGAAEGVFEVCIADTTGELQSLTQIADVVFVGKSLPPHREGQTPVEAAGLGRALVFGPGMANFRTIAHGLVTSGGARQVADVTELGQVVKALIVDRGERERVGKLGQAWHRNNRGALELTLNEIGRALGRT